MATTKFVNRARMLTSTTGTGSSITLTTAIAGYFTFAEAGLQDGDVVDYIIEQGDDFEIQHDQTYSSSGPSLSRGTPAASKVGGTAGTSKINLNGSAQVAIVGLAKSFDINTFTAKATPATDDVLWGHSTADGARRAIPISGVLDLMPTPGLVFLNSGTVSNAATLDILLTPYSSYRGIRCVLWNFLPANNDVELWLRLSKDGGATYDAGSGNYRYALVTRGDNWSNPAGVTSSSDTKIIVSGHSATNESISNTTDRGGTTTIVDIWNHTSTSYWPRVRAESVYALANGVTGIVTAQGHRVAAQNTDAVRFLFESGNIASGSWALYGWN